MVAKPQIDGTARGRAGVPLARAQRLAQKADAKSKQSRSRLPFVSLFLAVVVLGSAGFYYTEIAQKPAPIAAFVAPESASAAVANPSVEVAQINDGSAVIDTDIANQEQSIDEVVPFVETPQFAPRPVLAPCVRTIEQRLQSLYDVDDQNAEWDVKRRHIRDAVQSVLDCDQATFEVTGDFELASSDLADLQVVWDRSAANLKLTIVDSIPPSADQAVYTGDGQPIVFLVH
jgi:hypothetical protein